VNDSSQMEFKRLHISGEAKVNKGNDIAFENCQWTAPGTALEPTGVTGLRLTHCTFTGFQKAALALKDCEKADLRGNLYDNREGIGLRLDRAEAVQYSDYNGYRDASAAWEVAGKKSPLADVRQNHDRQSREGTEALLAAGPLGKPIGTCRDEALRVKLDLIHGPEVHSVSATTANIEWMTSLPATCELAWGDTPECRNTALFDVNYFGTYSLTGLTPGTMHYFRIKSLKVPQEMIDGIEAQEVQLDEAAVSLRTLKENPASATYYVAPDGDNGDTGLDRQHAWKTIHHAADNVNVGDTVLIAGGTYRERVRVRATGEEGSPITFKCMPGENVTMDGAAKALKSGFIAAGKSHLRFDGLRFVDFSLSASAEFDLYNGRDIAITRCFSDGRGGYTASSIVARQIENLWVKNCVNTNKMGSAMNLNRCPNLRLENNVFVEPMIMSLIINNTADQKVLIENNIFTDMMLKKAALNIQLAEVEEVESLQLKNNCFLMRCFPPEERKVFGFVDHATHSYTQILTLPEFDKKVADTHSIYADPGFAGDPGVAGNPADKTGYAPDRMLDPALALDFDSFFATNPEVVKRGIGLQREAFKDFKFKKAENNQKTTQDNGEVK